MVFGYSRHLSAGTGKSLTWCSYLDINNDSIGNIDKMRCIYTSGAAQTYCFHYIIWQNNTFTHHTCDNWLRNNLSEEDLKKIPYQPIDQNSESLTIRPTTLKNKQTGDIVIIHQNETSTELQECEIFRGYNSAGEFGDSPSDICWLGDEIDPKPFQDYIHP